MASLIDRYKQLLQPVGQKLSQVVSNSAQGYKNAFSAVGNKIDRDKSLAGVQVVPGGIKGGIARVASRPAAYYNVLSPQSMDRARAGGQMIASRTNSPIVKAAVGAGDEFIKNYQSGFRNIGQGIKNRNIGQVGVGVFQTVRPSLALYGGGYKAALANAGVSGTLSAAFEKYRGGDAAEAFGRGLTQGVNTTAVTRFTDPVIGRVAGYVAPKAGLLAKQLVQRGVAGVGNVAEDEILAGFDQYKNTNSDRALSLIIGAASAGNSDLLPKQLKEKIEAFVSGKAKSRLVDRSQQAKQLVKEVDTHLQTKVQPRDLKGRWAKQLEVKTRDPRLERMATIWGKSKGSLANVSAQMRKKFNDDVFDIVGGDPKKYTNFMSELKNSDPKWKQTSTGLLRLQNNDYAMGAVGGVEITEDENGKLQVTYNPEKGLAGAALMGGVKAIKNLPTKGVEATISKTTPEAISKQPELKVMKPEVQASVREADANLMKKVNALDYFRTPEAVLQKIGLGKQSDKIRTAYSEYQKELPKQIDQITSWYERVGKSPEASQRIFQYLDGKGVALEGEEKIVADEIKQYLSGWADRLGLPEDKRVSNYITHLFDEDFIKKEFDPEIEKLIADKVPGSVYDPFLQKRYGIDGYKEDAFQALDAYVKRATRKIHMDPALESLSKASEVLPLQSWNYVKSYADRINLRPTDVDNLVDTALKQIPHIGYKLGQRPVAKLSRGLRTMVYRGTLGLNVGSALRNLTQGANTYAELGERWTAKGYFDATKSLLSNSKELEETGVLGGSVIQDRSMSATKKAGEKLDKVLFGLFELAEKINRGAAYYGAKARALSNGKSEKEAIQDGIDIARKTQFTFGSVDTPVALQSDIVKSLTQFQSFNIKQAEFLLSKAKKREIAGLVRYVGAWTLFATAGKEVLGLDWQSAIPFASNVTESESPVAKTPPFQLASGVFRAGIKGEDKYGSKLEGNAIQRILGDDDVKKSVGAMTIPGFTQLKKSYEGIKSFNRGYSETKSGAVRFPIEQTPGNQIKTGLFGQYSTSEARDYFDNEKKPLGESQTEIFKTLSKEQGKEYLKAVDQEREINRVLKSLEDGEIDEQEAESLITKANASGEFSPLTDTKNKALREKLDSFTKKKIKLGLDVTEKELESAYLGTVSSLPSKSKYEKAIKDSKLYSLSSSIYGDEDLSESQKQLLNSKVASQIGIKTEDLEYYQVANDENNIKTIYVLEALQGQKNVIPYLEQGRRKVNEKQLVSNGVIDNLVDEGLISEIEGKRLKKIDFDRNGNLEKQGGSAKKPKIITPDMPKIPTIKLNTPRVRRIKTRKAPEYKIRKIRLKSGLKKTKKLTLR